jgi:hypothetical protein
MCAPNKYIVILSAAKELLLGGTVLDLLKQDREVGATASALFL